MTRDLVKYLRSCWQAVTEGAALIRDQHDTIVELTEQVIDLTALASCKNPSDHLRLARDLHRAEVELAQERGENPHLASVRAI